MSAAPPVTLIEVTHRYGRRVVLSAISAHVSAGECLGLVGPNGAGKTTLLRIIAGLVRPSGGLALVRVDQRQIRYFGGESTLPPGVRAHTWARRVAGACIGERRRVGRLSRGTRQWLGLTAVFHGDPPAVMLLDEPWEGLDPDGSRWLSGEVRRVKEVGAASVISSHRFHDLVGVCDAYLFIGAHGAVWTGAPAGAGDEGARDLLAAFDRWKGVER